MFEVLNVNWNILMTRLYSAKDCAKALDLKYDAFLRKVRKGQLKAIRVGHAVMMTRAQFKKAQTQVLNAHH